MLRDYQNALDRLTLAGWTVRLRTLKQALPSAVEIRFSWVPPDVQRFVMDLETAVSPDEKAWLLGMPDWLGSSSAAFKPNEWELMSLEAAKGNPALTTSIQTFWDRHLPLAHSVKNGYAYFAIRQADLSIVCGEEPEFEKPMVVASSLLELLRSFAEHDAKLSRWV
jgi:hypothetical protein